MNRFRAWSAGLIAATTLVIASIISGPAAAGVILGTDGICPQTAGHVAVGGGNTGSATACNAVITFNADGSVSTTLGPQTFYEGADDSLIGVVNNTGHTLTSVQLTSGVSQIFGFEGDGIDFYANFTGFTNCDNVTIICPTITGSSNDNTGYGGFDAFFTGINTALTSGTINFANGIGPGGTDFFALENPDQLGITALELSFIFPTGSTGVPEPMTLMLFGAGLAGLGGAARWKRKMNWGKAGRGDVSSAAQEQ